MKYLIVGLGNIGSEYSNTRHNIGFKVLDELARSFGTSFLEEKLAYRCDAKFKGRKIILIKPTTYMNLSGKAVNYWLQKEKISVDHLLIITDDLALPFGKQRLKSKGSDGGHNGLKDIVDKMNTTIFPRLRFGIGNDFQKGRQVNYVLNNWSEEEQDLLEKAMNLSLEIIKSFISIGCSRTMSSFNNNQGLLQN